MPSRRRKSSKSVTQQVSDVNKRYRQEVGKITTKQEQVVTAILIVIQSRAQFYTPQDTNALINSQYRQIISKDERMTVGRVGYTQNYALALHERLGWKPRPPGTPGKRGGGYNPNARPKFLQLGYVESKDDIQRIIRELNKI